MLPRATTTPMIAKDSMLEWLKSQIVRRNVTVKDDIAAVVARAQARRPVDILVN
ncbi:MAG: short-chain dehydrogenase/reductase, partial [Rhizobium sp.]